MIFDGVISPLLIIKVPPSEQFGNLFPFATIFAMSLEQ